MSIAARPGAEWRRGTVGVPTVGSRLRNRRGAHTRQDTFNGCVNASAAGISQPANQLAGSRGSEGFGACWMSSSPARARRSYTCELPLRGGQPLVRASYEYQTARSLTTVGSRKPPTANLMRATCSMPALEPVKAPLEPLKVPEPAAQLEALQRRS